MPINTAQGLEGLSEQQAIQQLQGNGAYQNLGTLTPYRDDRYGANGEGNGAVKTADGQELVAIGDGTFGAPLSNKLNVGGRRGAYVGRYDPTGKLVKVEFQPEGTGFLDKYPWAAVLVPVAGWATGLGAGAGSAAELASADAGMMGFTGAAPITESVATSLGAGATVADIASAAASGTPVTQLLPAIRALAPAALNALKAMLPQPIKNALNAVLGDGSGSDGMLNNLLNIGAGAAELQGLKNASNTAADAYGGLGDSLKGQYQYLGDKAQGMFSSLGATGQQGYENLGMKVGDTYNNLATQTGTAYTNLADKTKADIGKFTPYNITTNVGSTDATGKFTPTSGIQGVSDSATKAAQSSFDAGNAIDVNNLAKQRYDLMQSIFAPGDNEALAELRANQQARGRSGIQSLNTANSVGGVGANPAEVAYYKALGDRNLKAQATAADQALAQRGGLLSQGAGASQVPLAIGSQGLNQVQLGVQTGNTAFQNNLAGTQLASGIESRGLDQATGIRNRGIDQVTGMFGKGLDFNLGAQERGIQNNLGLFERGLNSSTPMYVNQIGQRYQGNLAATNALFSLLSAIARGSGQPAPTNTGNAVDAATGIANFLRSKGIPDAQIQQVLTSYGDQGQNIDSTSTGPGVSVWDENADL